MKSHRGIRTALAILGVCALGAGALLLIRPKEPSFEGRYLNAWIWSMNTAEPGPEKEKARAVVRQLATNSIPLLLKWLRQEDRPSLTGRFDQMRHAVFFWLVGHKLIPNGSIRSLRDVNPSHFGMATQALPELDHAGRLAVIPILVQMLGEKSGRPNEIPRVTGSAYVVLSKMAPESIEPLIEALSSHDLQVWALAAGALGVIGPDAKAAIPVLQLRLADKDPLVRVEAAGVIGKLGGDPNLFLPVVIQSLTNVDAMSLDAPLEILLRYPEQAKPAVPVLLGILQDNPISANPTNALVQNVVINTLRQIAPEVLTKEQVQ